MPKPERPLFYCKHCGNEYARWEGKCPACGEWDALIESPREPKPTGRARGAGGSTGGARRTGAAGPSRARPLREFAAQRLPRLPIPIGEFDRVLGGGAVPGGSVLVGGEPGIGKSTLLLQVLGALAAGLPTEGILSSPTAGAGRQRPTAEPHAADDSTAELANPQSAIRNPKSSARPLLYISGEEAPSQIAARGLRLGEAQAEMAARPSRASAGASHAKQGGGDNGGVRYSFAHPALRLASETDLEAILELMEGERPRVLVVDSVQTLRDGGIASAPGSISQVRECTMALVDAARRHDVVLFLIGHVTKEGTLAGPRVLEHVVDTVLSFEGDTRLGLRVLRALKNRFGSTHEVGLFEMTGAGLLEVPDPSSALLDRDGATDKGAGSAVGALCEGSRVLLVEVQALTVPAPGGGSPRRRATGLDVNRLAMLLAVLETKAGVPFGALDVFVSAAGGFEVDEPAADLPLALALGSVATGRPVRSGLVSAGEVGLGGELRPVPRVEARIGEAQRLGFTSLLLPARGRDGEGTQARGLKILRARTLREALALGLE